jgi:hypothetical protein
MLNGHIGEKNTLGVKDRASVIDGYQLIGTSSGAGSLLGKCQELRRLEPSRRDFDHRIDDATEWARRNKMHPTRLETIK